MRYLKTQGLLLLCGGLVGPIFLVVYFALGADPLLKWMFWSGLAVTAGIVLAALAMTARGANSAAKAQFLEQHGVLALARVTGLTETGTRINHQPLVKVRLHIEGGGVAPFDVEDRVIASVSQLPMITSGRLVVLVDPADNSHHIDWERSALISGMVPAQFTLDEDNRTYDLSGQVEPLMEIMGILKANNVPLSGSVDIRSLPEVRRQVMDAVRSAVAPVAASPDPAPGLPVSQRLAELEALRGSGAVTEAEYTAKRQQIIAEL